MSFTLPSRLRHRVVVTGIGLVTPLAVGTDATMQRLLQGDRAGRSLREVPFFFPTTLTSQQQQDQILSALPCSVACPVVEGGDQAYSTKSRFAPTSREPRSHKFCLAAVEEALVDGGLLPAATTTTTTTATSGSKKTPTPSWMHEFRFDRFGVNIGMGITSLSDVAETAALLYNDTSKCHYSKVHPFFVPKILGNMAAGNVAIHYGFRGPIGSSVAACATGAQCIGDAARWVQDGLADFAVCGATEACISPISMAGFARMRAMATGHKDSPMSASRPFDEARSGFVMGEGSGILLLESLESATRRRAAKIYGELCGFGSSCDAYHVSSPHPDGIGATQCVTSALRDADMSDMRDVVYVNAHATGTPMGDEIELKALTDLVNACGRRQEPVVVSSTKGSLGHLLGASGSVEAAVTVASLARGVAPPTANLEAPIAHNEALIHLNRTQCPLPVRPSSTAISTSFGFGGINTALVFRRLE